ncbi:hypothetical protein BGZ46_001902, partial [Entomortierella lignicola]
LRRPHLRGGATQLYALFNNENHNNYDTIDHNNLTSNTSRDNLNLHPTNDSSPYSISSSNTQLTSSQSFLSASLSKWLPPACSIPLAQLQTALAHRFLRWALSENLVEEPLKEQELIEHVHVHAEQNVEGLLEEQQEITIDQTLIDIDASTKQQAQQMSLFDAGQDWASAHDLVWAEGDYYIAQKTCIREGVAHLKRGRRYIFVEPVLGPASSYLYPKSTTNVDHHSTATTSTSSTENHSESEAHEYSSEASENETEFEHGGNLALEDSHQNSHEPAQEKDLDDEGEEEMEYSGQDIETDDRAQQTADNKLALACDNERIEKEEMEGDNTTTNNNNNSTSSNPENVVDANNNNTTVNGNIVGTSASPAVISSTDSNSNNPNSSSNINNNSSSSLEEVDYQDNTDHILDISRLLEPYSPLLDPSTDGQDQFEYGLYELQYIPKIQHLLPQQFLPTRQRFIVHLDEDRPTLASPVPLHSKRSECRCQIMMRKELMQRDLLQVWPAIEPVKTLQERQQDAEEEARIMEIKQKVQMQTKNWRETLHTQMVACG